MKTGPILIGGVGGSGTRLVADIIKQMGVSIGNNLNASNDYMTVAPYFPTMRDLLKSRTEDNAAQIDQQILGIMESFIPEIYKDNPDATSGRPWGWKIPANFYFIPYLKVIFPDLKYIHTIRNGLDMAFSNNQNQLKNWGDYFGIDLTEGPIEKASLEYWIQGNKLALTNRRALGNEHFTIVNYDSLCKNPAPTLHTLNNFLNIIDINVNDIISLISCPDTQGRYKSNDCSVFTKSQLAYVHSFGFDIPQPIVANQPT